MTNRWPDTIPAELSCVVINLLPLDFEFEHW